MLSVTIITLNEEEDLPKCLESVKDLADETVIVDSGSSDKTVEIAKKFGAKVFVRKFDNYSSQKNFAADMAKGDWILSIDADEEIEPALIDEIKLKLQSLKSGINGFSIPRKNIILGKYIKYTRWQPELDRHIWLWKKSAGKWVNEVHEEVMVEGKVEKLKNAKIHKQYRSVEEFFQMMVRYSQFDAEERFKKGIRFSYLKLFFDPLYNFLVRYFYRLGFLDGWRGFILSYLMAVYHLIVWVKIWENDRK